MELHDDRVKPISTEELKKKLENKEDFLLIDVNPLDQFEKHHIKSSTFVDYEGAGRWFRENNVSKDKVIVLYCENSMCTASPIVAKKLVTLGYTNVYEYSKGVQGWIEAGGEWKGTG